MTTLLTSTTATGATATEGDVKTYLTNIRDFIADLLGTDSTNKASVLALIGNALHGKVSKSGAYTVVSTDRGKVIDCTGTWTMNITAAASLGDGFVFAVRNSGSGTITIDPNLTETINGQSTLPVGAGGFHLIYCDGVGFSVVGASAQKGCQVFTTTGVFTIPSGVTALKATVIGGGGGGGGANVSTSGGGGGAGGAAIAYLSGLTPGLTITIGAIGAGGAGTTTNGSAGGTSSISSGTQTITTVSATGGAGGIAGNISGDGGLGGAGSGGNLNLSGGGGGAGSMTGNVGSGMGGSSLLGGGGRGREPNTNGSGASGAAYGSGGSGAYSATTSVAGGAGAPGVVIFEW